MFNTNHKLRPKKKLPVAFPPLPPPTGVGVLVSTLITLDRYAEISAASLPVAVLLLPLPALFVKPLA